MPVQFEFKSGFICERVMQEADGIISAFRIVDVFFIPEGAPPTMPLQFYAVCSLRSIPAPAEEFHVGVTFVRTNGEREPLPPPSDKPLKAKSSADDPASPGGLSIVMQFNIKPKDETGFKTGTAFIEIDVDGEPVLRIPFTIKRIGPT